MGGTLYKPLNSQFILHLRFRIADLILRIRILVYKNLLATSLFLTDMAIGYSSFDRQIVTALTLWSPSVKFYCFYPGYVGKYKFTVLDLCLLLQLCSISIKKVYIYWMYLITHYIRGEDKYTFYALFSYFYKRFENITKHP